MNRHMFWFDLKLTYEEISKLEKARKKYGLSQMGYIEKILREALAKEEEGDVH